MKRELAEQTLKDLSRAEYLRRYPGSNYEAYLATNEMLRNYYSQPSEVISADLKAQHDEDRDRGFSTD